MSTLVEIKKELKKYGLPIYGNKDECRKRLHEYLIEFDESESDDDLDGGCCCDEMLGGGISNGNAFDYEMRKAKIFDNKDNINQMDNIIRTNAIRKRKQYGVPSYSLRLKILQEVSKVLKNEYNDLMKNDINYDNSVSDFDILQFVIKDIQKLM